MGFERVFDNAWRLVHIINDPVGAHEFVTDKCAPRGQGSRRKRESPVYMGTLEIKLYEL